MMMGNSRICILDRWDAHITFRRFRRPFSVATCARPVTKGPKTRKPRFHLWHGRRSRETKSSRSYPVFMSGISGVRYCFFEFLILFFFFRRKSNIVHPIADHTRATRSSELQQDKYGLGDALSYRLRPLVLPPTSNSGRT